MHIICHNNNIPVPFAVKIQNLCHISVDRYFCKLKALLANANGKRPVKQTTWICYYIEHLGWNGLPFALGSKMMEAMEGCEVWWPNLELLPRQPSQKAGNEKKREIAFWRPLKNEYPFLHLKTIK